MVIGGVPDDRLKAPVVGKRVSAPKIPGFGETYRPRQGQYCFGVGIRSIFGQRRPGVWRIVMEQQ